jgi:hypothetical protein
MAIINRCAVGIGPRQPLIEWSRRVSGEEAISWHDNDHGLYLLPPYEDDEEGWEVLQKIYGTIFEKELSSWCADPELWPGPRSFSMFMDWFEIRFYDLIDDLCEAELNHERIDPDFVAEVREALRPQSPD